MSWFTTLVNYTPVLGTAKGFTQVVTGDTEGGLQAMKDSVKIVAATGFVAASAFGGAVISEADDEINWEDRQDGADGTIDMVKKIWNW